MITDDIVRGYLEAAKFTDCGDEDQPSADLEFSEAAKHRAWSVCHKFNLGASEALAECSASAEQVGHDLWLTRNGHGTGFWDRPKLYGRWKDALSIAARVLWEAHVYEHGGLLEIEEG